MSWKTNIQVRDLDPDQKLELTCTQCGHVHYLTPEIILRAPERGFLYLDEIERESICRARGCRGAVRLALVRNKDTSAFVGGLA
ncbi:hypothetical protein NAC44_11270 [Allorhizobium sp. BGMRC 0089]|uniref:hypothetical protein n=1 Tax=Allorhizobium sonneratiae TaxID=2934936 RepID=UPI002033BC18|nr:hypothetical protein [Allorhizobium sonneratiae]MCM2292904.1 hypothetical protein [Allorhizobium sonneratiae]